VAQPEIVRHGDENFPCARRGSETSANESS